MEIEITVGGRRLIAAKCDVCHSVFWPPTLMDAHTQWHETLYSRSEKWFPADDAAKHRPKKGGRPPRKKKKPKININVRQIRKKGS